MGGGVGASPLFTIRSLLFPDLLRGVEASAGEGRWGHAFECGRTHAQGQSSAVLAHGVALARMGEGHSKEKKKAMHVQANRTSLTSKCTCKILFHNFLFFFSFYQ